MYHLSFYFYFIFLFLYILFFFFFFSSRRRHTRWPRDWSSDVCSSDLALATAARMVGRNWLAGFPSLEILIGNGAKRRNSRGAESAYPPRARSHLGRSLARRVISASIPIPATQQK